MPNVPNGYIARGLCYCGIREYDKAVNDLTHANQLCAGKLPEPYGALGLVYEAQGNLASAIEYYTKAIELDPKSPKGYIERARVYKAKGEQEKAAKDDEMAKRWSLLDAGPKR